MIGSTTMIVIVIRILVAVWVVAAAAAKELELLVLAGTVRRSCAGAGGSTGRRWR